MQAGVASADEEALGVQRLPEGGALVRANGRLGGVRRLPDDAAVERFVQFQRLVSRSFVLAVILISGDEGPKVLFGWLPTLALNLAILMVPLWWAQQRVLRGTTKEPSAAVPFRRLSFRATFRMMFGPRPWLGPLVCFVATAPFGLLPVFPAVPAALGVSALTLALGLWTLVVGITVGWFVALGFALGSPKRGA